MRFAGFAFRHRFHGKAEVVMGAVGHAAAHALAREVAIVVDDDHAGGHDIDLC